MGGGGDYKKSPKWQRLPRTSLDPACYLATALQRQDSAQELQRIQDDKSLHRTPSTVILFFAQGRKRGLNFWYCGHIFSSTLKKALPSSDSASLFSRGSDARHKGEGTVPERKVASADKRARGTGIRMPTSPSFKEEVAVSPPASLPACLPAGSLEQKLLLTRPEYGSHNRRLNPSSTC